MATRRKFGTFGGVFTPAILTILGVIMYLRLPRIVGEAGMWATMGIVLVAHLISITTGLSVSSIATDKRVKAGGTYYVLSRSLGLPIGGTLGVALFVGLSFSVSLYLIGFSESFLSFWELPTDTSSIRIAGTLALLTVTGVTLISTALAIKAQYFIMAAIAVSLLSILVGNGDSWPVEPHVQPIQGGASLAVLFGIFFPAVTGFEAGVSMSGDLRDPKHSIPRGTLTAIFFGLLVYLLLVPFLAYRIPAERLMDSTVLLDMAWSSNLVVPGIWGATISSALGSILGAPRILQAVSKDRIGPRFLGVGHGAEDEPRNALLLTFAIAECGILIGELDTIARVVSMFFLASYAFLNMAAAIEATVSPDFRPDFRVPRVVSVVGAVTCVLLMFQLDPLAMVGAIVVLGGLFLVLQRQQLVLENGDTWDGVWSSLVRMGLARLGASTTHARNWRPNILVFTGDDDRRETVVHLCRAIAKGRGVITELQLHPQHADPPPAREDPEAIPAPTLVVATDAPWQALAHAAHFHGLPGLWPNTAMLDWSLLQGEPTQAARVLSELTAREMNLVVALVPDHVVLAGAQHVDVWWLGPSQNLSLGLALVRLLTGDPSWNGATLRFLAVAPDPSQLRIVRQRIKQWLRDARVDASVRVLEEAEGDPLEHVARVSARADLTLVGLPEQIEMDTLPAAARVLGRGHRVTLLIRASTPFAPPFSAIAGEARGPASSRPSGEQSLDLAGSIRDPELAAHVVHAHRELRAVLSEFVAGLAGQLADHRAGLAADVERLLARALDQIANTRLEQSDARRGRARARIQRGTLAAIRAALDAFQVEAPTRHRDTLSAVLVELVERLAEVELGISRQVVLTLGDSGGQPVAGVPEEGFTHVLESIRRVRRIPLRARTTRLMDQEVVPA